MNGNLASKLTLNSSFRISKSIVPFFNELQLIILQRQWISETWSRFSTTKEMTTMMKIAERGHESCLYRGPGVSEVSTHRTVGYRRQDTKVDKVNDMLVSS